MNILVRRLINILTVGLLFLMLFVLHQLLLEDLRKSFHLHKVDDVKRDYVSKGRQRPTKESSQSDDFFQSRRKAKVIKIKEGLTNGIKRNKTKSKLTTFERVSFKINRPAIKVSSTQKYAQTKISTQTSIQTQSHNVLNNTTALKNSKNTFKQITMKSGQNKTNERPQYPIDYLKGIKVGDLYEDGFLISNKDLCKHNGEGLMVLILVASATKHENRRNAIRSTWGKFAHGKNLTIGFVIGHTANKSEQTTIDKEIKTYGDIIQVKFIDEYNNLTLKIVSMLEWTQTYCPKVHFILKTDDDIFLNVPRLLSFIETKQNEKNSIFGHLYVNTPPIRMKNSKWYIDPIVYPLNIYPNYVAGPAYLLTSDVIEPLYKKTKESICLFGIEDVLITGFVAERLNITRVAAPNFIKYGGQKSFCEVKIYTAIHGVVSEMFNINKQFLEQKKIC